MKYGESYGWIDDTLDIISKFYDDSRKKAGEWRMKEIVNHYQCDLSDFARWLKSERGLILKLPPKTNADRIRAMTDEELAEFIRQMHWNTGGIVYADDHLIDWLREEAKDGL